MNQWRRIMLALALGVAVTGAAACSKKEDKAAKEKMEDEKLSAERTEAKKKLQTDYEAAERKAQALKEKAAKATGAAKKNADAAVAELDKRWETLKADMAALDPTKGDTWDATKKKVEEGTVEVNKAIDAVEAALKGK